MKAQLLLPRFATDFIVLLVNIFASVDTAAAELTDLPASEYNTDNI